MKALFIDTPNKQITEIELAKDYDIAALIHADIFTAVGLDDCDAIYVDDEGLINGNPHGWFGVGNYPQPLRGYGLVLGCDDEGASIAPRVTLDELRAAVRFYDDSELNEPEAYAGFEVVGFNDSGQLLAAMFGHR